MILSWTSTAIFGSSVLMFMYYLGKKFYEYIFVPPSLKNISYPYKETGCWYRVKYWIIWLYLLVFRTKQRRFNAYGAYGRNSIDCGMKPTPLQRLLESPVVLSSNQVTDEVYFMGVNHKTNDLLELRVARRPSMKGQSWFVFDVDHCGQRKSYEIPSSLECILKSKSATNWTVNDIKLWCLEPLLKWRLYYNGFLIDRNTGQVDHVKISYIWKPYTMVFDHLDIVSNNSLAKALANSDLPHSKEVINNILNQYDEWGSFIGTYTINNDEEKELILQGMKSRQIGNFQWTHIHQFLQISSYFEDGSVISFYAISTYCGVPELVWGYVETSGGFTNKITDVDFSLQRMEALKTFPEMMSIRILTDSENFILDVHNLDSNKGGDRKHYSWGENVGTDVMKVKTQLTNVTVDLVVEGTGVVQHRCRDEVNSSDKVNTSKISSHLQELTRTVHEPRSRLLCLTDPNCANDVCTGGKGASLAVLKSISLFLSSSTDDRIKFEVPNGFCVTIQAYEEHIENNAEISSAISNLVHVACGKVSGIINDASLSVVKLFQSSELSKGLQDDIRNSLHRLYGDSFEKIKFAVRSSATGEDGEELSGAGQLQTFLGCLRVKNIFDAIKKCWGSCYAYRAVEYRRHNGQLIDVCMSVVVQEMVSSDVAGVMFTRDPVTGNPGNIAISSNYGLGESVVSASTEPDSILVKRTYDNKLSISEIVVGKKQIQVRMKGDGGVEEVNNDNLNDKCSLTNQQALFLAHVALIIEESYGDPRDIEWAIKDDIVYLLQARPITSLYKMSEHNLINEFNDPIKTDLDMISCGNVGEVMSGAASPIFITYFNHLFRFVVIRTGYMFLKPQKPTPLWAGTGFVYKWYHFFNRSNMVYTMNDKNPTAEQLRINDGVDIALSGRLFDDKEARIHAIKRFRYSSRYTLFRRKFDGFMNVSMGKRYLKSMQRKYQNWSIGYERFKTARKLHDVIFNKINGLADAMLYHCLITFSSVAINAAVFLGLIGSSEDDVTTDHYGDFAQLMSIDHYTDEVESADVPTALKKLSQLINERIDVKKFFSLTNEEAVELLTASDSPVKEEFDNFLKKHGHRCFREFDPLSKPWIMDPKKLIAPLQAVMKVKHHNVVQKLSVDEAITQLKTKLSTDQKKSLKKYVIQARKFVAYREQAKSLLIRTVHEYRKAVYRLGDMMTRDGIVPDKELICYMTPYELETIVHTRSSTIVQRALRRRRLQPSLEDQKFPEISYGLPKAIVDRDVPHDRNSLLIIQGTPISQGVVKATVRVVINIDDAHQIQPGDILATYSTDVAWSPYFPSLSGVITELGGLISHGAVIAREYQIPCVVGVTNVTSLLQSGETIILNGTTGTIEKIRD